jgi:ribosomal protein S18 acetylase RimI-like enzyme
MTINDLGSVCDLGAKLFTSKRWPTLYRTWDEHEVLELFSSDEKYCLVAEMDERVVGFALGSMIHKPRSSWTYGWLLWLGVARSCKRRGIGARLVNRLTELFIEDGSRMMLVDTDDENHTAIALFRKMGFTNDMKHVYLFRNLQSHPKYAELSAG